MPQGKFQANVKSRVRIREPHMWAVIFWNDDFTTMDFVVKALKEVFLKSEQDAERLMMTIHKEGQAQVGAYSYDIAISRTKLATEMARKEGFPLRITYQEV